MATTPHYPQKILIVEDEMSMRMSLRDSLSGAGFERVLEAKDGEEGLALALRENPDLILLDVLMPKMDGMTMLNKLCRDGQCRNTKVILLTNLQADESIMKGVITHEPSYYLVKAEFSINDVINKVKSTLGLEPLPTVDKCLDSIES